MRPKSSYFDSQKISTFRTAKSWHLSGLEFLLRKWKKSFFCGYSALVSPINFVMAMLQNFGKGQVCGRGSAPSVQEIFRTDRTLLLQEIKSLALWFFPYRYFNLPNGNWVLCLTDSTLLKAMYWKRICCFILDFKALCDEEKWVNSFSVSSGPIGWGAG